MERFTYPHAADEGLAQERARAFEATLKELERWRRSHLFFVPLAALALGAILFFPATLFILISTANLNSPELTFALLAVATLLPGAFSAFIIMNHDYRRRIKIKIIQSLAQKENIKYENFRTVVFLGDIHDHYILPSFSKLTAEDCFTLNIKGRKVKIQELRVFAKNKSNRDFMDFASHYFTLWGRTNKNGEQYHQKERAILIQIKSRKNQLYHTVVLPKSELESRWHKMRYKGMQHYERTPFGNTGISENYIVLSEKHVDAHDIFDPAFIERFNSFKELMMCESMAASFKGNQIVFYARLSRDFFEPGHLLKPVTYERIYKIMDELDGLQRLIESLELNTHTGV